MSDPLQNYSRLGLLQGDRHNSRGNSLFVGKYKTLNFT